jgi:hypothetical protein
MSSSPGAWCRAPDLVLDRMDRWQPRWVAAERLCSCMRALRWQQYVWAAGLCSRMRRATLGGACVAPRNVWDTGTLINSS